MGHNITETPTWDTPIPVPDDLDPETATTPPYPVDPAFAALADRTFYLRTAWASIGSPFVGLRRYLSLGTTTVTVQAATNFTAAGLTLQRTTSLGVTVSGAAFAVYYLYAFVSGGALTYEATTNPPDAYGYQENGDATRQYIGAVQLDSAGVPMAGRYRNGEMIYRISSMALSNTQVLSSGAATVFTDVQCHIPPTGYNVLLQVMIVNSAGSSANVFLQTSGDSASDYVVLPVSANASYSTMLWLATDNSGTIAYKVSAATTAVTLNVLGWREDS